MVRMLVCWRLAGLLVMCRIAAAISPVFSHTFVGKFQLLVSKGYSMKSFVLGVVMLLVAATTTQPVVGGIIDSFDSPAQLVVSGVPGLDTNNALSPQSLGGWRELQAFGSFGNLTGTAGVLQGNLVFGNGPAGPGSLDVNYTSNNLGLGGGLGTNLLLGGSTAFSIDVIADDTIPTILNYRVEDIFGNVSTRFANIGGSAAGTTFIVPFADFTGTANFEVAKFLRMTITGGANADITLDNLQTINIVPEPSSLVLALSALTIGGVIARRRMKYPPTTG